LGPLDTAATNRSIAAAPVDYDDEEICRMIGRGNRSIQRKPAQVPFCPPQTPHAAQTRTRVAVVGSQRLIIIISYHPNYFCVLKLVYFLSCCARKKYINKLNTSIFLHFVLNILL
jgi:hypothetical protein